MTKILCTALPQGVKNWQIEQLLLPHQNINAQLRDWLSEGGRPAQDTYVGIFAVDPFVSWGELVEQLRHCGVNKVCNFPPVAAWPPEFVQLLDAAGNGLSGEQSRLQWFTKQGFKLAWVAARDAHWSGVEPPQLTLRMGMRSNELRSFEQLFELNQVQGV